MNEFIFGRENLQVKWLVGNVMHYAPFKATEVRQGYVAKAWMIDWVYDILASSSYFNDLHSAFRVLVHQTVPAASCPMCKKLPCFAMEDPKPTWLQYQVEDDFPTFRSLRFRAYHLLRKDFRRGHRVPIESCAVLAIRIQYPEYPYQGFPAHKCSESGLTSPRRSIE